MSQPHLSAATPPRLSSRELRAALDTLQAIGEACTGSTDFARRGVEHLPRLVGSDLTTLVVCDLDQGHRTVVPSGMISRREIEVFDRYFYDHPLVRAHGRNPNAVTKRIDDLVAPAEFHRTPLYNDYYRPIRIEHAMAVPIHVDGRFLVSFVFNRSGSGFTDRDRDLAEVMRPHLANLYRLGVAIEKTRELPADAPFDRAAAPLTRARARGARLGGGGQDEPRRRGDPGREPAHGREASRADLREARRRDPHRRSDAGDQAGAAGRLTLAEVHADRAERAAVGGRRVAVGVHHVAQ